MLLLLGILRSIVSIYKENSRSISLFSVQFLRNLQSIDQIIKGISNRSKVSLKCSYFWEFFWSIVSICKGNSRSVSLFSIQFLENIRSIGYNFQRKKDTQNEHALYETSIWWIITTKSPALHYNWPQNKTCHSILQCTTKFPMTQVYVLQWWRNRRT